MFTGLIEAVGTVESLRSSSAGLRIVIRCPSVASRLAVGDSVNVDGVCQTVVASSPLLFSVEAVGDTLVKTTFRKLVPGVKVNLERALRADGGLSGHFVMGHVTGTALIVSWAPAADVIGTDAAAWFLVLDLDPLWSDRVVAEGSIAVDGISLTVAQLTHTATFAQTSSLRARISVIPHTRQVTALTAKKAGDMVNIELDILASYARAAVRAVLGRTGIITREALNDWGHS